MTVIDIYNQFAVLPNSFTIDGVIYEHTTMDKSDGTWYAYKMNGKLRTIHSCAVGRTEEEAISNLVKQNTSEQQ
jgi:hypothetical protein